MPGLGFAQPDLCSTRIVDEQEEPAEAVRGGATVMDAVFGDADDAGNGDGQPGTGAGKAP